MSMLVTPFGAFGGDPTDPYFTSVVQLAHFDGANASTVFTNSCPRGTTLAPAVNGQLSTTQKKWGTASLRVVAPSDAAADGSTSADYGFGTGDFTLEWWQRLDGITAGQNIVFFGASTTVDGIYTANPGKPHYYAASVNRIVGANNLLIAATWQFIAYSKVSSNGVLYIDGTSAGSWADTRDYGSTGCLWIGRASTGAGATGYIDDFRATKGVGRYSGGTCAVPTAAFPNS